MNRLRITASADSDIRKTAEWIARDSLQGALSWLDALDGQFSRIARSPGTGTERNDLRPRLRSTHFGAYVIFFRRTRAGVTIIRIIHGARDYRRMFRR
jgi:toxin ParE1/3/4